MTLTKPVMCRDDRGQDWVVYEGDTGARLVDALYHQGVRDIVLPRSAYCSGVLTDVSINANMDTWDASNPAVAKRIIQQVRLHDCVQWLKDHPVEVHGNGSTEYQRASDPDLGH